MVFFPHVVIFSASPSLFLWSQFEHRHGQNQIKTGSQEVFDSYNDWSQLDSNVSCVGSEMMVDCVTKWKFHTLICLLLTVEPKRIFPPKTFATFTRFLTKELLWQTSPLSTWAHIMFLLNYSNIDSQFPFIRNFLSVIFIFHNPGFLITTALFDIKENGEICRMVDIVNKDRCNNGKYFSSLV